MYRMLRLVQKHGHDIDAAVMEVLGRSDAAPQKEHRENTQLQGPMDGWGDLGGLGGLGYGEHVPCTTYQRCRE